MQKFVRCPSTEEAFWPLVKRGEGENACWTWLGQMRFHNGEHVPWFKHKKTSTAAPRYAWQSVSGEYLHANKRLVRKCDEPLCIRPEHRVPVALGGGKSNEQLLTEAAERAKDTQLREQEATRVVAVRSPAELQDSQRAAMVASAVAKELTTIRISLDRLPQLLSPIVAEVKAMAIEVMSIEEELIELRKLLEQRFVTPAQPLSVNATSLSANSKELSAQPLSAYLPALSAKDPAVATVVAALPSSGNGEGVVLDPTSELAGLLKWPLVLLGDEQNVAIVERMSNDLGGGPKVARERLSSWMRTFRSLVASGVLDATSAQFVEAAKAGLFSSTSSAG